MDLLVRQNRQDLGSFRKRRKGLRGDLDGCDRQGARADGRHREVLLRTESSDFLVTEEKILLNRSLGSGSRLHVLEALLESAQPPSIPRLLDHWRAIDDDRLALVVWAAPRQKRLERR